MHQRNIVEVKELPVTCYLQGSICIQAVSRLCQVPYQEKLQIGTLSVNFSHFIQPRLVVKFCSYVCFLKVGILYEAQAKVNGVNICL